MARIVVIGAGVAGLAVAARLRVKRHDVTIVEQATTYGGKLASTRHGAFVFDTGPSLLTLPAVYRDLFNKTGRALEESVDLRPVDPGFGYHFADGTHLTMPGVDPGRCAQALGDAFGGRAAADWRALMQRAAAVWSLTRGPVLSSPVAGARDLLPLARRPQDLRAVAPWRSLHSLGRSHFADPRLVTLLDRYATYTGADPRRAPAALVTIPYVEQLFGAWHLGGGLATLADALAERCRERGVQLRLGTEVVQVTADGGRVTGVALAGGERLAADVVVADTDARQLYTELVPSDRRLRGAVRRVSRATASSSGFSLLLALRGRDPKLLHHNVFFPADYDAEFDALFGRDPRPVDDPAIYICNPDDDAMRPPDGQAWSVLVNAPRHGSAAAQDGTVDWRAPGVAEAYADHLLAVLARRGVDIRDRVLWRAIRTPADIAADTHSPGGAIYGSASNGPRAAFLRPANRSPLPGLFLVGGSAHPGGGLPLVGLSAEIVADLVGRA
ncbi:MAG: phytoene desaturase [Actinomycetota bacterium]|nr:MAG: phytoene desaturase [Actinomycetota bacterium]